MTARSIFKEAEYLPTPDGLFLEVDPQGGIMEVTEQLLNSFGISRPQWWDTYQGEEGDWLCQQ